VIYQLVLITNLGLITPLMTFSNYEECIREQVKIPKTAQASASCLPAQSPEQIQKQIEQNMQMMSKILNNLQTQAK
jgi:hypothetical protein